MNVHPILLEDPQGLAQLAKTLPGYRGNQTIHAATLFRWIIQGVTLPNGERVKLEALRIGGRFVSSQAALSRFFEKQTQARCNLPALPASARTPAEADAAARAAGAKLQAMGARRGAGAESTANRGGGTGKKRGKRREVVTA